jgi:predicted Zn finger-like uncharacterized protein
MILECPSCHARYMVQIGLFAQGGRQVRCARCRNEWHATLPNHIEVYLAPIVPEGEAPSTPAADIAPSPPLAHEAGDGAATTSSANLPAVIKTWGRFRHSVLFKRLRLASFWGLGFVVLILWPVMDRQKIVKVFPDLKGTYEMIGLHIDHNVNGLMFDQVKSELRYDGGTMRLYVDGIIHNTTPETQFIPDIKARALGPDQRIIQSWWVEAPAATVAAGSDVPFHTEVNAPMKRTIEDVYLEFYAQDEKGDVAQ